MRNHTIDSVIAIIIAILIIAVLYLLFVGSYSGSYFKSAVFPAQAVAYPTNQASVYYSLYPSSNTSTYTYSGQPYMYQSQYPATTYYNNTYSSTSTR